MPAGGYGGAPSQSGGNFATGDQRTMGRRAYAPRAGSGLMSVQNDDMGEWLKYLADVGRGSPTPGRTNGFSGVRRR